MFIRPYKVTDWPRVKAIYQAGIDTGMATFERAPKSQQAFEEDSIKDMIFVATEDGVITGWATLWPTSKRACYQGVAEVSVYVAPEYGRRGIGKKLLDSIADASEEKGIWTLQAGILAVNEKSIDLHAKCGFKVVGRREKIAKIQDQWMDMILMERRSLNVL